MARNKYLIRYWIHFGCPDRTNVAAPIQKHYGVTAYSEEDAISILRSEVFCEAPMPPIVEIRPNVDVSTLDSGHVLPNIGDVTRRGVWWPSLNL